MGCLYLTVNSCFFPTNKTLPYRQQDVRARGQRGPPLPFYQCSAKQGSICGPPIRETEGQTCLGISRIFLPDTSRMGRKLLYCCLLCFRLWFWTPSFEEMLLSCYSHFVTPRMTEQMHPRKSWCVPALFFLSYSKRVKIAIYFPGWFVSHFSSVPLKEGNGGLAKLNAVFHKCYSV